MNSIDQRLRSDHTPEAIQKRLGAMHQHNYLGDFVLGAIDGAVTTFAIVAGAVGAGLSNGVVLVLGVANVLADGFSMAVSNFLRAKSDLDVLERFRKMEEMHIDHIPEGERDEIREIYRAKGFQGELLEQIVEVITEDRRQWINTMLTEEWGLRLQPPSAWRSGVATFLAFVIVGFIPLLPAMAWLHHPADRSFILCSIVTALTFFLIGLARGKIVNRPMLLSGFETLAVGGLAAIIAFAVGQLLENFAAA